MLSEFVKTADFKSEKHVPVIECAPAAKAGEPFSVSVSVGREIPHPNTAAHHIDWIALHFVPDGMKLSTEIGRYSFAAHPADPAAGAQIQSVPSIAATVVLDRPGRFYATAYCNLHGLWESERPVALA